MARDDISPDLAIKDGSDLESVAIYPVFVWRSLNSYCHITILLTQDENGKTLKCAFCCQAPDGGNKKLPSRNNVT